MSIIKKIEDAIAALDDERESMILSIENSTWEDDRKNNWIPEEIIDKSNRLMALYSTRKKPEKAPIPAGLSREYRQWNSGVRALVYRNYPNAVNELDEAHGKANSILSSSHITQDNVFRLIDQINTQMDILSSVPTHIRYSLVDAELEAYAILIDDQLEASRHLQSKGFLRAAGGLAGVLLERHIKTLLRKHDPPIKYRKNATLSTLNDLAKEKAYDFVTWRKVQHLTDLRNLCAHDRKNEPTNENVQDLINGVSSIIRSHN